MSEAQLILNSISNHLAGYAYRYSSEVALHESLAKVLKAQGFELIQEHRLDARNRFDFWINGIVIEVKVDGSLSDALRQVNRYINLPEVKGVILAGTPRWAGEPLAQKPEWNGKPFKMVRLARQFL